MSIVFVTRSKLGRTAVAALLDEGADVATIVTRPKGSDVADQADVWSVADKHDVPVFETTDVNGEAARQRMGKVNPDLLFVVGWSRLVTRTVIDIPSQMALGMHPSPLPRGRGRAPLAWPLIKGMDRTALTLFKLVEKADAGDIVEQQWIDIERTDDVGSLYEKVERAAAQIIGEFYAAYREGDVHTREQDEGNATWWPQRTPDHGLIDWRDTPRDVYNWIRGQSRPYPGAYSYIDNQKVTVWQANPPTGERVFVRPGEIHRREGDSLYVGVFEGIVELTEIGIDGRSLPAGALLDELDVDCGDRFETARDRID